MVITDPGFVTDSVSNSSAAFKKARKPSPFQYDLLLEQSLLRGFVCFTSQIHEVSSKNKKNYLRQFTLGVELLVLQPIFLLGRLSFGMTASAFVTDWRSDQSHPTGRTLRNEFCFHKTAVIARCLFPSLQGAIRQKRLRDRATHS